MSEQNYITGCHRCGKKPCECLGAPPVSKTEVAGEISVGDPIRKLLEHMFHMKNVHVSFGTGDLSVHVILIPQERSQEFVQHVGKFFNAVIL